MFLGQYEHSIDEKGRLTVPFRFRSLLEDGAYIMRGLDGNLWLMPTADFQRISEKVGKMNIANPTAREFKRLVFSYAEYAKPDETGRILIPQLLRQLAELDSSVVVVGAGTYVEIWSPERWALQANKMNDTETTTQKFSELDLSY